MMYIELPLRTLSRLDQPDWDPQCTETVPICVIVHFMHRAIFLGQVSIHHIHELIIYIFLGGSFTPYQLSIERMIGIQANLIAQLHSFT